MYKKGIALVSIFFFLTSFSAESPTDYQFTRATMQDADTLLELAVASHANYQTCLKKKSPFLGQELFDTGIVEMLHNQNMVIGFYAFAMKKDTESKTSELSHFFIKKEIQRHGFGRILFNRMISTAETHGYHKVSWVSDPHAQGFYQKMGASIIGYDGCVLSKKSSAPIFMYTIKSEFNS